jgi:hypothetical protein
MSSRAPFLYSIRFCKSCKTLHGGFVVVFAKVAEEPQRKLVGNLGGTYVSLVFQKSTGEMALVLEIRCTYCRVRL